MKPIRVGYVVQQFPSYSETFIQREIDALRSHGLEVILFSLRPDPGLAAAREAIYFSPRQLLKNVFPLGYLSLLRIRAIPQLFSTLRPAHTRRSIWMNISRALFIIRRLNRGGVHHLHAHFLTMPALLAYIVSCLSPTTFSLSAHAKDIHQPDCGQSPEVFQHAKKIFFCTEDGLRTFKNRFPGFPEDRLMLMRHGIEISSSVADRSASSEHLIAAGRLTSKKGFIHLLKAVAALRKKERPVRLTLYGEGPEESRLQTFIEKHRLKEWVRIEPFIPTSELIAEIARSRLFIQPSVRTTTGDRDGIPNVILEAMAVKTPVIVGNLPPIREVFSDETASFVDPANTPAFVETIERMLDNPAMAESRAKQAYEVVSNTFDIRRNIAPLLDAFREASRAKIHLLEGLEATIGGTRKHLDLLLRHLPKDRFDITFAYAALRSKAVLASVEAYERDGVRTAHLAMKRRAAPLADLKCILHMSRLLMNHRFDVLHFHSSKAGLVGRLAGWLCGYEQVLYSPHAFAFLGCNNPLLKRILVASERMLAPRTKKFVMVSDAELDVARRAGILQDDDHGVRIHNALPPAPFHVRKTRSVKTLGFLGRLERQHGCVALVRTLIGHFKENPDGTCLMGGAGRLRHRLEGMVRENGMTSRIMFLGEVLDVDGYYASIDLLLVPSLWAGYPYVLLEAVQRGLPVLASDIPPHAEILGADSPRLFEVSEGGVLRKLAEVRRDPGNVLDVSDYREGAILPSFEDQMRKITDLYQSLSAG